MKEKKEWNNKPKCNNSHNAQPIGIFTIPAAKKKPSSALVNREPLRTLWCQSPTIAGTIYFEQTPKVKPVQNQMANVQTSQDKAVVDHSKTGSKNLFFFNQENFKTQSCGLYSSSSDNIHYGWQSD